MWWQASESCSRSHRIQLAWRFGMLRLRFGKSIAVAPEHRSSRTRSSFYGIDWRNMTMLSEGNDRRPRLPFPVGSPVWKLRKPRAVDIYDLPSGRAPSWAAKRISKTIELWVKPGDDPIFQEILAAQPVDVGYGFPEILIAYYVGEPRHEHHRLKRVVTDCLIDKFKELCSERSQIE